MAFNLEPACGQITLDVCANVRITYWKWSSGSLPMRVLRYSLGGSVFHGVCRAGKTISRLRGDPFGGLDYTGDVDDLGQVKVLAPVDRPRIFGLGYNYVDHIAETGRPTPDIPVLFMKPSTSAIGPGDSIVYPTEGRNIHFEGELVIVIGKGGRGISEDNALAHVFGCTCGNDVSDRVLQRRESQFGCLLAGKGYDTFAPIGPAIETEIDPSDARIVTRVNGVVRQNESTAKMRFSVPFIVAYLSRYITLLPGDLIMTGTPSGVGPMQVGDQIEVAIEGIGSLVNQVVAETA